MNNFNDTKFSVDLKKIHFLQPLAILHLTIKNRMCFNVIHNPSMQESSPKHILQQWTESRTGS
jgi:hypothetical protein